MQLCQNGETSGTIHLCQERKTENIKLETQKEKKIKRKKVTYWFKSFMSANRVEVASRKPLSIPISTTISFITS